jgi:uncharacterized protein
MPKKVSVILLLVIISLQLFAQQEQSLLWEISGNGLKQNSYIFGTIHIIKKNDFFLSDVVKDKVKHSQVFITEVDMNIPLLKQLELVQKMYLPDNKTLMDYVSPEDFRIFSTLVKDSLGLSPSKFNKYIRIKPFFTSSLLIKQVVGKIKAYERELYKIAKNQGIPSDGLETIDFQLSLVDDTPLTEQAKELVEEVKNYRQSLANYDEMVKIYKQQDLEKLYTMVVNDSTTDSEFNEKFIFKRNSEWIPIIENRIKDYSCFIAVGGAHLPGENGVLALLRKQGYTISPIKE